MKASSKPRTNSTPSVAGQRQGYLSALPPGTRRAIKQIREAIKSTAPDAVEVFSYGIPGFRLDGKIFLWYAGWREHISLYPMTQGTKRALGAALQPYEMSKGTIRFPLAKALPIGLIKRIARARAKEIRS